MNLTKTALRYPYLLWTGIFLSAFSWLGALQNPVRAAERVYVSYGILERSIPVLSLEAYAKNGTIDDDLAVYARYGDAKQLQQLKSVLVARADVDLVAVSQFLYTPQGEVLLKRLGQVIQPESRDSGFKAIRAALILAAADPDGLTLLNVLRKFPTRGLRIDVERSLEIAAALQQLVNQAKQATTIVLQAAQQEQATEAIAVNQLADIRQRGPYTWQKQTLALVDTTRSAVLNPTSADAAAPPVGGGIPTVPVANSTIGRSVPVDLYIPNQLTPAAPMPVIVISHGLGSDRTTFAYLAIHLASYGFAVLVPEHPGSNAARLQALINGTASEVSEPAEFVNRPLDITFVLNQVESLVNATPNLQGRLNFQQVGVLGQSFGGYTALTLAGAPINPQQLQASCQNLENTLNLSLLLQCRASDLKQPIPTLQDARIKAVIAINPITSAVMGQTSISQIKVPTMIVTGNADTIAPAVPEQIQPFTWLTMADRYLVMLQGGTHFSTLDSSNSRDALPLPQEVVGPNPAIARRYMNALAVAFFQTYLANNAADRSYLSATYSSAISEVPFPLTLIRSLTAEQLAQGLANNPSTAATRSP
ncbi:MAG: alpha/beta hydrolase [Lyngbya sp. HA4199-MV5]|jgi:predicted dienelactone hydrolase|nr:alpha/beta hydrolase [Lyngbya sp. HA4199-MV5]